MRRLRLLSALLVCAAYATMVLGAYVKAIGAGMACSQWPSCEGGQFVPSLLDPGVVAELAHRTAAVLVALTGLALLALLFKRFRQERKLLQITVAAAATLGIQIGLGAITIASFLEPVVVTAHLAVATLFFGLSLLIAFSAWRVNAVSGLATGPRQAPSPAPEAEPHSPSSVR